MRMIIVFAAVLALAVAAPQRFQQQAQPQPQQFQQPQPQQYQQPQPYQQQNPQDVVVVREVLHNNIGLDGYQYSYELSDGQQKEETAELKNAGSEDEALVVRGSYSWVDSDGQIHRIEYTADENGFHPIGEDVPV